MATLPLDAALDTVEPGPSPLSLADSNDFVVFLQRDHSCRNCRDQVRTVADRIDERREGLL